MLSLNKCENVGLIIDVCQVKSYNVWQPLKLQLVMCARIRLRVAWSSTGICGLGNSATAYIVLFVLIDQCKPYGHCPLVSVLPLELV